MDSEKYVVPHDVEGKTDDGRTYLIASAGQEFSIKQAREMGLLKDEQKSAPSETKGKTAKGKKGDGLVAPPSSGNAGTPPDPKDPVDH